MGRVNPPLGWAVCTWLDLSTGKTYALDLDASEFTSFGTEFDAQALTTIDSIMAPRIPPLMALRITAPVRLLKKCTSHQQCIDTAQQMLNGRRP